MNLRTWNRRVSPSSNAAAESLGERVSVRMVSLKLSHIYGGIFRTELSLDEQSRKRDNERRLAGVLDSLRENQSIMRGHDLWLKQREGKPRAGHGATQLR